MRAARAAAVVLATSTCAPASPSESLPRDRDDWVVFDVDVPDRDSRDLLRSFEYSAKAHGCRATREGGWSAGLPGGGRMRAYSAVRERCEEGTIEMAAVELHRVRIGCPKPATQEQCVSLLGQISPARP